MWQLETVPQQSLTCSHFYILFTFSDLWMGSYCFWDAVIKMPHLWLKFNSHLFSELWATTRLHGYCCPLERPKLTAAPIYADQQLFRGDLISTSFLFSNSCSSLPRAYSFSRFLYQTGIPTCGVAVSSSEKALLDPVTALTLLHQCKSLILPWCFHQHLWLLFSSPNLMQFCKPFKSPSAQLSLFKILSMCLLGRHKQRLLPHGPALSFLYVSKTILLALF